MCLSAQFKKKDIKSIPSKYETIIESHENSKGELLSYKSFKRGMMAPANKAEISTLMTTMLLGSGLYWVRFFEENFDDFTYEVIKPNGFTSSKFILLLKSSELEVYLVRKMVYASIFTNPSAAEYPENYGMLIGIYSKYNEKSIEYLNRFIGFMKEESISFRIASDGE